jgi:hypothetical protein
MTKVKKSVLILVDLAADDQHQILREEISKLKENLFFFLACNSSRIIWKQVISLKGREKVSFNRFFAFLMLSLIF